jgi:hypothetical protein
MTNQPVYTLTVTPNRMRYTINGREFGVSDMDKMEAILLVDTLVATGIEVEISDNLEMAVNEAKGIQGRYLDLYSRDNAIKNTIRELLPEFVSNPFEAGIPTDVWIEPEQINFVRTG